MVDAPRDEAVQSFPTIAAIDTCAVWNILCSQTLTAAVRGRCHFILAEYIRYECLLKRWKSPESAALRTRLSGELASGKHFTVHSLEIDDLRELAANVGALGRFDYGELAALALARKLQSGFLTDDRAARRIGESTIGANRVRTTPHLVGWLVYDGHLTDGDIPTIIADNASLNKRYGSLGEFIQVCYEHAMGLKLRLR
ncbi:hypothetical protein [Rhodospira trueperi]|uniref:PIN domain-containing protein n=1 Tax=Rhodospira trueperi TaxID=69960 RepID=A0A1G7HT21_9PROT|nr:hypothetical protein [Rhodospira trueperi]SDF03493.1 hypothetical protein SAMN05421720_1257 [Rhodospira trueperi]